MRRGRFHRGVFIAALVLSLAWHGLWVIPHMIAPLVLAQSQPKEIEIAYMADDAPADNSNTPTPPADQKPPPPLAKVDQPKKKPEKEKKKPDEKKPPEVAQVEPPKPKPVEPPKPVPPPPPPPPQPPPPMDHRMKMVEQEQFPDEKDNASATYLSEKNHRAEKETRDANTNLLRQTQGQEHVSEESENKEKDIGAKNEKIAELENRPGIEKNVVRSPALAGQEGQGSSPERPGPLSMRDLTPRALTQTEQQALRDGVEQQESEAGELPMARVGKDGQRAVTAQRGSKANLNLTHRQFDSVEGFQAAEDERRQAARAEISHPKGIYARYLSKAAALRSTIENFTPEVKVGNQAELGTRASPFAKYITEMHRQIHKLWTFGFLADLDNKPSANSPYNNQELWTQLEIVIKGDGKVDKVTIVHGSGVLAFDVAAIDSVMSSSPFPPPPQVIKSANGKTYLDWQFHRDERACGTFGVDPHILTTPGDPTSHDTSEAGAAGHALMKAQQARHEGAAGNTGNAAAQNNAAPAEGARHLTREPAPSSEEEAAEGTGEGDTRATPASVPEVTPEARTAAESWFDALTRHDAAWLAGWSAVPFQSAGTVTAKDPTALKELYKQLVAETSQRKHGPVEVLTPAGIRGKLGGLPPGGEESGMLYGVAKVGNDELIVLLKKSSQGWRVCGVDR